MKGHASSAKMVRTKSRGDEEDATPTQHRRIRHITSIRVRNLTPFPARDEFASALAQPSEQPQFNAHGHLSDDLDVALGRRRSRRRSSTSISSAALHASGPFDAEHTAQVAEASGRRRAESRASTVGSSTVGAASNQKGRLTTNPPPARSLRQRTLSTTSIRSVATSLSLDHAVPSSMLSLSGFLRDTSQEALERIIQSRLVETFLTITISSAQDGVTTGAPQSSPSVARLRASTQEEGKMTRRSTITASGSSTLPKSSAISRVGSGSLHPRTPRAGPSTSHTKSMSVSSVPNGKSAVKPSAPKGLASRAPIPPQLRTPSVAQLPFPPTAVPDLPCEPSVPDYISPLHRPSTNPCFEIDPQGGYEFAADADLKSSQMLVEIWGRLSQSSRDTGKGKERASSLSEGDGGDERDWRILKTWHVDLDKLVPLTEQLAHHPSRLPPNTLCITVEPSGQTYYLPDSRPTLTRSPPSRSPSPSIGYSSDPESNTRHAEPRTLASTVGNNPQIRSHDPPATSLTEKREPTSETTVSRWKRQRTSATWQSVMKAVTLQSCIQDTEQSVADVAREIEPYLIEPSTLAFVHEISERDRRVNDLRSETITVEKRSEKLHRQIREKREELLQRKSVLAAARGVHAEDLQREAEYDTFVEEAKVDLALLRNRLTPIRNELFMSLVFIYPIELLSPPDLLFTILDVPLPIPSGPTEPAPPLSLSSHKDVNEDTVATALGYAAQLVQLLAAYLSKRLVYPITCIGSRSVIKDGISAMVGPRSFPLFSKGVDTYRFEYGVFLLNKDIEMLMVERNLRALDMRHTLPNLKNLLLTLADPDTIELRPHRPMSIASTTISALQSPVLAPSMADSESQGSQPLVDGASLEPPRIEIDSPPASGSTTPTRSIAESTSTTTTRKSRAFLDLAPLSGFFRVRYPSSSRSSAKAESPLEDDHHGETTPTITSSSTPFSHSQEESTGSGDDEDDRRTIRGTTSEDEIPERKHLHRAKALPKNLTNGTGNGIMVDHRREATAEEKLADKLRVSPQVMNGVS